MKIVHYSGVEQLEDYYPFGLTFNSYSRENSVVQDYKFNGKEEQTELGLGWLDYGARIYQPELGRWGAADLLSENSISITPYHYVGNSPIAFLDPNGLDWFYYKTEGDEDAAWHWQEGSEYEHSYTYKDKDGKEQTGSIKLQGVKAAIVFDGREGENLGEGNSLYGEGAQLASVTVYGPSGADDIETYEGYTLSTDPSRFGVVESNSTDWLSANAYYKGSNRKKSRGLYSFWLIDEDGVVPARNGYNPSNGSSVVRGAFIHSAPKSGKMDWVQNFYKAGYQQPFGATYINSPRHGYNYSHSVYRGVSEGCLIIAPGSNGADWRRFVDQMGGKGKKMSFAVQVLR
jgi:RHS repeat-associated protein